MESIQNRVQMTFLVLAWKKAIQSFIWTPLFFKMSCFVFCRTNKNHTDLKQKIDWVDDDRIFILGYSCFVQYIECIFVLVSHCNLHFTCICRSNLQSKINETFMKAFWVFPVESLPIHVFESFIDSPMCQIHNWNEAKRHFEIVMFTTICCSAS